MIRDRLVADLVISDYFVTCGLIYLYEDAYDTCVCWSLKRHVRKLKRWQSAAGWWLDGRHFLSYAESRSRGHRTQLLAAERQTARYDDEDSWIIKRRRRRRRRRQLCLVFPAELGTYGGQTAGVQDRRLTLLSTIATTHRFRGFHACFSHGLTLHNGFCFSLCHFTRFIWLSCARLSWLVSAR